MQNQASKNQGGKTWLLLVVGVSILCAFNIKEKRDLEAKLIETASAGGEISHSEFQASQRLALAQAGSFLRWPKDLEINHGEARYRLILAIDEQSCGTCRDSETRFVAKLAAEIGEDRVVIIVHAENLRYVRAYQQVNGLALPVIQDKSGAFFEQNQIVQTPMALLVNERDEVIAAHFPTPGKPEMSQPFHEMLLKSFGVNANRLE